MLQPYEVSKTFRNQRWSCKARLSLLRDFVSVRHHITSDISSSLAAISARQGRGEDGHVMAVDAADSSIRPF